VRGPLEQGKGRRMSEFTITAVHGHKPWTSEQYGTFNIYDVEFEGLTASGKGQIKQKESTAAPTVGMTIDAELVRKGDYPPELKRIPKQGGGGGGGWKPKSPEEHQAINRAVAQKNAIALLGVEAQLGREVEVKAEFHGSPASVLLQQRVDWLYADLERAAGRGA